MRPRWLVVGLVLTAALALVALPGLAGSRASRPLATVPVSALQPLPDTGVTGLAPLTIDGLDTAFVTAGAVGPNDAFIEPGKAPLVGLTSRPKTGSPLPAAGSERKPEKYKLTGFASFYDNGTTAMRLPRGTIVIICGAGGCLQRVVNDYGPQKPERIVDMYQPDFFAICGCPSWSGTTEVTVYVY